jgi:hypothetical protein
VPAIVVIGPTEALDALRAQLPEDSPLQAFTDIQIREAVEFIATHRPAIVAIEEGFAVSPRGEALVGRIMDDPALKTCEIRVLAYAKPDREKARRRSGTGIRLASLPSPATPPGPASPHAAGSDTGMGRQGTRRAERIRMIEGVSVTVDGNPAELVDLSALGAQVVSRIVLRPNQRVRVQLPENKADGRRAFRCSASVVWASFEMPSGQPPRYRAGLKLSGAEADALQHFAMLHRAPGPDQAD